MYWHIYGVRVMCVVLLVLDSDKILIVDPAFNYFVKRYADSQDLFFQDYAAVSRHY